MSEVFIQSLFAGLISAVIVTGFFSGILFFRNRQKNSRKKKALYDNLAYCIYYLEIEFVNYICLVIVENDLKKETKKRLSILNQIKLLSNQLTSITMSHLHFLEPSIQSTLLYWTSDWFNELLLDLKPVQPHDSRKLIYEKVLNIYLIINFIDGLDDVKKQINNFNPKLLENIHCNAVQTAERLLCIKYSSTKYKIDNSTLFHDFNSKKLIIDSKGTFWFKRNDISSNWLILKLKDSKSLINSSK